MAEVLRPIHPHRSLNAFAPPDEMMVIGVVVVVMVAVAVLIIHVGTPFTTTCRPAGSTVMYWPLPLV